MIGIFPTEALAVSQILTSAGTWASAGTAVGTNVGDASDAAASDNINIASFALKITNDQTANDGSGLDIFNLGTIKGTTGTITIDTGNATDLLVNILAINFSNKGNVGNLNLTNATNTNQAVTLNVTGGITLRGNLDITNVATAAKSINVTVGGVSVIGKSALTAGGFAGASNVALTVNGGSTFVGALAVTAGDDMAASAILTLNGSSSGAITLADGVAGLASLIISGGATQIISGTIDGGVAGQGDITINNTNGVTFSSNVGATQLRKLVITDGITKFSGTLDVVNTSIAALGTLTTTGVATTPILFTGAGAANINGGLTGDIDLAGNAAAITIGDGSNITGNIDSTGASNGTLSFFGTSVVSGKIGATNALTSISAGAVLGKTVSFNDDVAAAVLNINGLGDVSLNGNLTGNINFGVNDGSVTLADTKAISGTVDSGAFSTGTLTIKGSLNFLNTIGATNSLKLVNAGENSKTVTFNSAVNSTTINVTGTGTVDFLAMGTGKLNFKADGSSTIKAGWTGAIDSNIVNNGTVTFNTVSPVGITTIGATAALKKLELSGVNLTTSGSINVNELIIGGNIINTTAAGFTLTNGQTVYFDATNSIGNSGRITLGGANVINLQSGSTIVLSLKTGNTVNIGDNITLMTGGASANANNASVVSGTPGFSFINSSAGNNFIVKVAAVTNPSAQDSNLANQYTALSIGNGLNVDITNLNTAIDAAIKVKDKNNLRESAMPGNDSGLSISSAEVQAKISSIIDNRVSAVRRNYYTGMAGGEGGEGKSAWAESYVSSAIQDIREGIQGYSAKFAGVALGIDSKDILEGGILGASANYSLISIDSNNPNNTLTSINGYGLSLYSNFNLSSNIFVDAQVGYSYNDINIRRHNVGGVIGTTARGNSSSTQYSSKFGMGLDYVMSNGLVLTPGIFASYAHLNTLGYTEKGAGGLNMKVSTDSSNSLDLGFILKSSADFISDNGDLIKPQIKFGYARNVMIDKIISTSSFTGNPGTSFTTASATPSKNSFNAGIGLTYTSITNWDMSVKYDFIFKKDYLSHNGTIRLTSHF